MSQDLEINLRNLKRNDPSIDAIICQATQVAMYQLNGVEWVRMNIEGSLFIVSRKNSTYNIVIHNRLNTTNLVEPITAKHELKKETPFLMIKTDRNDVQCVWFYQPEECEQVGQKLQELVGLLQARQQQDGRHSILNGGTTAAAASGVGGQPAAAGQNGFSVEQTLARLGIGLTRAPEDSSASEPQQQNPAQLNSTENILQSIFSQAAPPQKTSLIKNGNIITESLLAGKEASPQKSFVPVSNSSATTPAGSRSLNVLQLFHEHESSVVNHASQLEAMFDRKPTKTAKNAKSPTNCSEVPILTPSFLKKQKPASGENFSTELEILSQQKTGFELERSSSPPKISQRLQASGSSKLYKPDACKQANQLGANSAANSNNSVSANPLTMEQLKQTLVHLLHNDADFLHYIYTTYTNVLSKTS